MSIPFRKNTASPCETAKRFDITFGTGRVAPTRLAVPTCKSSPICCVQLGCCIAKIMHHDSHDRTSSRWARQDKGKHSFEEYNTGLGKTAPRFLGRHCVDTYDTVPDWYYIHNTNNGDVRKHKKTKHLGVDRFFFTSPCEFFRIRVAPNHGIQHWGWALLARGKCCQVPT